ncbi:MAG: hypothetical protein A2V70_02125 [Planctomycetes bacterium RBG_13_63_9]|nr:MAG: hypothetical protein A2V70_02125 [Planctomycetes bacterium RBG_13_63_9]
MSTILPSIPPAMTRDIPVADDLKAWLAAFEAKHGHPPRVLHIGNIANNAYINAKLLNAAGVDCDVLCYDYYHIMGCPEWEDADFDGEFKNQFVPDWGAVDLNGFERPRWFAQGPLKCCIRYLVAKRQGKRLKAWFFWQVMEAYRHQISSQDLRHLRTVARTIRFLVSLIPRLENAWLRLRNTARAIPLAVLPRPIKAPLRRLASRWHASPDSCSFFNRRVEELIQSFQDAFPHRPDKLTATDLSRYRQITPSMRDLLSRYDIVQAYATDPIYPLLCGKRPYLAFEHGTLRTFTMDDEPVHRTTALAYNRADHAFITNGDCLEYARKINVPNFSPMLHPIDEQRIRDVPGQYAALHEQYRAKYLFLCTLRHEWEIKGTDAYLRALPALRQAIGCSFKVILTKWGREIEESRNLIRQLGAEDLVVWVEPLPRIKLISTLKSVDVLFDQISLPHFGATAPEGIAAEVPVIMSYDPRSTAWIVPEPAPILSAWTVEDVVKDVLLAIDPAWLKDYKIRARDWFDRCHSSRLVVDGHLRTYAQVWGPANASERSNHEPTSPTTQTALRGDCQVLGLQDNGVRLQSA